VALDGGTASVSGILAKMADDSAMGGVAFDATTDSLHSIAATVGAGVAAILAAIAAMIAGPIAQILRFVQWIKMSLSKIFKDKL